MQILLDNPTNPTSVTFRVWARMGSNVFQGWTEWRLTVPVSLDCSEGATYILPHYLTASGDKPCFGDGSPDVVITL